MDFTKKIVEPWTDPVDLLDRKKYAVYLTNYLASLEKPFVLNVNADWGLGKTFFLRSWAASIKDKHPVVYINAWENDFSDDPLLTILSSIKSQLFDYLNDGSEAKVAISNVLKTSGRILKKVAPIVVRGLINKAIGPEAGNDITNIQLENSSDQYVASIAQESTRLLLEDHEANTRNMNDFREALEELLNNVIQDSKKNIPAFIFIDELDRCRPTYAIELLENVKHLFSVNGSVFIIATDSAQLQHSVCAVYGDAFNGSEYLRRFFDREFTLPIPSYMQLAKMLTQSFDGYDRFIESPFIPQHRNGDTPDLIANQNSDFCEWIDFSAISYELSTRSLIQAYNQLVTILANSGKKRWHLPFLLFLLFLFSKDNKLFGIVESAVKNNNLTENLLELLPKSSESVHWSYQSNYRGAQSKSIHLNMNEIGNIYISSIIHFSSLEPRKYAEKGQSINTLENFIARSMYQQKVENVNREVKFQEYFDAIRMAGFF
ncbi:MAG: P-loop NTPase fold protein, partial [Candidatus Thiodiazotropha sp.]